MAILAIESALDVAIMFNDTDMIAIYIYNNPIIKSR